MNKFSHIFLAQKSCFTVRSFPSSRSWKRDFDDDWCACAIWYLIHKSCTVSIFNRIQYECLYNLQKVRLPPSRLRMPLCSAMAGSASMGCQVTSPHGEAGWRIHCQVNTQFTSLLYCYKFLLITYVHYPLSSGIFLDTMYGCWMWFHDLGSWDLNSWNQPLNYSGPHHFIHL